MSQQSDEISFGSDSFLDVMANMVGILIILVLIAVLRSNHVKHSEAKPGEKTMAQLSALAAESQGTERDIKRIAREGMIIQNLTAARQAERDSLALLVTAAQHELETRRQKLGLDSREEYDLRRALLNTETELERAALDLSGKTKPKSTTTKIETFPTPISRTVTGNETHFQLLHGRITYVPMDELVKLLQAELPERMQRLRDHSEVEDTVGPIGGFRLHYVLERTDTAVQIGGSGGTRSSVSGSYKLIPVEGESGETLEQALRPKSDFRAVIRELRPRDATITFWTYPDSFATYRALKKELYMLGFPVAGRPLPEGQLIGGSSSGTRSAAE